MATTAQRIIKSAFRKCRIKKPEASDVNEAFLTLNEMLGSLGSDLLFPYVVRESFDLTTGDGEYTIGDGGDFDTVRPFYVMNAYLRNDDQDETLTQISLEDYNRIEDKSLEGIPHGFVYLPEYPLGKILFSCEPQTNYEFYIESVKPFTEFTAQATSTSLPPEYSEFLIYNLAVRLAEENDVQVNKSLYAMADDTRDKIEHLLAINRKVPGSRFDFGTLTLTGKQMGGFGQGDIDSGVWP